MNSTPPKVSVVVFVYNHEKYLEKTLASINAQDISGGLEIVIHDDASTDNSEAVYRRIAETSRYPIKIIRQAENKYSQQISMWPYILAECTAPYIAICEGDDFWLAPEKLAYQSDALDQLPHIDLAFHKVARVYWEGEGMLGYYADYGEEPKICSSAEVIEGDGGFIPTPSLMCRRSVFDGLPDWFFEKPPIEDYFIQVFGALRGGALYMPMCGAAYREGDPQSWSQRSISSIERATNFELHFIEYMLRLRATLPEQFTPHVDNLMQRHYLLLCRLCFSHHRSAELIRLGQLFERYQ